MWKGKDSDEQSVIQTGPLGVKFIYLFIYFWSSLFDVTSYITVLGRLTSDMGHR